MPPRFGDTCSGELAPTRAYTSTKLHAHVVRSRRIPTRRRMNSTASAVGADVLRPARCRTSPTRHRTPRPARRRGHGCRLLAGLGPSVDLRRAHPPEVRRPRADPEVELTAWITTAQPGEELGDRVLVGARASSTVDLEQPVEDHPRAAGLAEPRERHAVRRPASSKLRRSRPRRRDDRARGRLGEERHVDGAGRPAAVTANPSPPSIADFGQGDREAAVAAVVRRGQQVATRAASTSSRCSARLALEVERRRAPATTPSTTSANSEPPSSGKVSPSR